MLLALPDETAEELGLRAQDVCCCWRSLLDSFQSSLDEITLVARPEEGLGGTTLTKAVQLKSYNDPSKCVR